MMNCAKSLKLLSDYHDGSLNVIEAVRVRMHLMICPSCRGIFHDLEQIISTAAELRDKSAAAWPDDKAGWRRVESNAWQIRPTIFRSPGRERPLT
jgi:predicted anti-sigma-YlaC factor YlaD